MSRIPVYCSHSYRRDDRDLNVHFWHLFHDAGFSFTVDPGSDALSTTTLERMMARSVGFVAVVPYRPEQQNYQCSPFIVYEHGLAVQVNRPRLVLRDKRVSPNAFRSPDTLVVAYDLVALDRSDSELADKLRQFHDATSRHPASRRYRQGLVGVALGTTADIESASRSERSAIVEQFIKAGGDDVVDLHTVADDPVEFARTADGCDFVVVDIDDDRTGGIADYLLGRGTPLLRVARRDPERRLPDRLLGGAALRIATEGDDTAEVVTYWSDLAEFESRLRHQLALATTDRTEFASFEDGRRYFRRRGRQAGTVFVSNAASVNPLARELTSALELDSIPFFHYRYHNTIGRGEKWADALDDLIEQSTVFVPLIDDTYWESPYCQSEYRTAVRLAEAGRITIVPGLLDGYERGKGTVVYQGIDLRERSDRVEVMVGQLDEELATPDGPVTAGTTEVDVAIVTILPEEYSAVLRFLSGQRRVVGTAELPDQHAWVLGEVDPASGGAPYTVALAMSQKPGTAAALNCTRNTLAAFDPRHLLVVGVAGGLGDQRLGDVVVADRICAYEYGKVEDGFQPRVTNDSDTDGSLATAARALAVRYPDWYRGLDLPEPFGSLTPRITVGQVASGDKVVDDLSDPFFAAVLASRPKVEAVEMEAAGGAAAILDAQQKSGPVGFGMIRGISDVPRAGGSAAGRQARESGGTEIRDSWKERASVTAAACAVALIRLSWPEGPRGRSAP